MVLIGAVFGTMNSSSTNLALLGLVAEDLEQARLRDLAIARFAEPVPLELPSLRPDSMASITCWRRRT
jgi:hypothetical protein